MCGIIGGYSLEKIDIGLDSIRHRGPDARDTKKISLVDFGHVRLNVMDTDPRSNQPFSVNNLTIIFNGSIWNYREIRSYLTDKYEIQFITDGDTEVIAHLIDKEDIGGFHRVQGMFAIAWTRGNNDITIIRDRYGEVPIHYSLLETSLFPHFMFCSEIKGLLSMGVASSTIKSLKPGTYIRTTNDGYINSEMGVWYDLEKSINFKDYSNRIDAGKMIKGCIDEGSIERTVSAVPVCTLLSGGIDSSVIALAAKKTIPNLVGYIAVYNKKSPDLRCARSMAEMLDMELVEVEVDVPNQEEIREVIQTIEMDSKSQIEIAWPCIKLAERMSSDGFRVVLSGEGADELWLSYGMSYHKIQMHGWTQARLKEFGNQERKNFSRCNKVFMKYGMEPRLPFLNTSLVENSLGISQDIVWDGKRKPKAIMQEAYRKLLPKEIVERNKLAFQDGMGIKQQYENILDKNPKVWYSNSFKKQFRK